jgi:hypothetical protein
MPRRQIQRAFLSWLEDNRGRFALDITLGKRTDTVQEFSFVGINPAISGALTTWEIEVWAIRDDHRWDILLNLEVVTGSKRGISATSSLGQKRLRRFAVSPSNIEMRAFA